MKSFRHTIGHIVSCKDVSHLVSRMQDNELSTIERWKLKLHLAACDKCMAFMSQLRFLREAMRKYRQ